MSVQGDEFASIKIRIVFQAGQIEMSAGDIEGLAPGMIIATGRDEADAIDIVANGRKIATGELVKVEDKLAVRVTRLKADA